MSPLPESTDHDEQGWSSPLDQRWLSEQTPADTGAEMVTDAGAGEDREPVAPGLLDRVRSGRWLDQQTFPALRWAVQGVVPEGFGLLVAPPKAGKSWWALGIALAAASGGKALGCIPVDQRPVLYLALEDGHRRLQGRCRYLLGDDPIPASLGVVIDATPTEVRLIIAEWLQLHRQDAPLILLDTLGKVMPPTRAGETPYARDYRVCGACCANLRRVCGAVWSWPGKIPCEVRDPEVGSGV